ncbi:Protein asteroid like protein 1 [Chelonia mydas]|uniref:Protein asteroid like protein 1 n=1 Tax=Chelonia mydas TaxID=8469 RepID=M7B122_CHEMY|nr:Protein asteroid like protein 1 [Chelonia mydas]
MRPAPPGSGGREDVCSGKGRVWRSGTESPELGQLRVPYTARTEGLSPPAALEFPWGTEGGARRCVKRGPECDLTASATSPAGFARAPGGEAPLMSALSSCTPLPEPCRVVPRSVRLKLLLETLGVKASILQPIPNPLWLPVAVTCYWTCYSEPKVKLHHLQALLLGMVFGELHRTTSSPDPAVFHVEDDKMVYDQFLKWKEKNFQKLLDLDTAHTFCQWQCCLQMGLHLNQLLSTPLTEPDLTRLYCGTLVHRLCKVLKSVHAAENQLLSSPKMSQLYCDLLHAVKSTVPPDFFQETTKTTKSCKEKNKQATSQAETTRQHATLEAQPLCDINNRFASLMVED